MATKSEQRELERLLELRDVIKGMEAQVRLLREELGEAAVAPPLRLVTSDSGKGA